MIYHIQIVATVRVEAETEAEALAQAPKMVREGVLGIDILEFRISHFVRSCEDTGH